MNKRIFIGSIFSIVLLLSIPPIQAIEYFFLIKENKLVTNYNLQKINYNKHKQYRNGSIGFLELLIGVLLFLYIQFGILFNRSFTLILLLASILYELGLRLGLIEPSNFFM
jgi:hypothetical protein